MKKSWVVVFCVLALLIISCETQDRYRANYLTLFNTVTTIQGYDKSQESFNKKANEIHDKLLEYHKLFDIYHTYEGLNNLKTINDQAGVSAVVVDKNIIDLLLFAKQVYEDTQGAVNVAMGSVLRLWHEARLSETLPKTEDLIQAQKHMDINQLIIDEKASTVFLKDPLMSLDVGSLAKGFAVEAVASTLDEGYLINAGGNVCTTGKKPDGSSWNIALQGVSGVMGDNSYTLKIDKNSVVTSGDYQRSFVVDGVSYHHIIDPKTLTSANFYKAVSVICPNSAIADALSTALFLLPIEKGKELLKKYEAEALWTLSDSTEVFSDGFKNFLVN